MSDDPNEISLKDAAKLLQDEHYGPSIAERQRALIPDYAAEQRKLKRERETGEATAVLEAMLAAGRAGKRVKR